MNSYFVLTLFFLLAFVAGFFLSDDNTDKTQMARGISSEEVLEKAQSSIQGDLELSNQGDKYLFTFSMLSTSISKNLTVDWQIIRHNVALPQTNQNLVMLNRGKKLILTRTFFQNEIQPNDLVVVHAWYIDDNGEKTGLLKNIKIQESSLTGAVIEAPQLLPKPKKIFY